MAKNTKKPGSACCEIGFVLYLMSQNKDFRKAVKEDAEAAYDRLGISLSPEQIAALKGVKHVKAKRTYRKMLRQFTASVMRKDAKTGKEEIGNMSGFGRSGVAHRCSDAKY